MHTNAIIAVALWSRTLSGAVINRRKPFLNPYLDEIGFTRQVTIVLNDSLRTVQETDDHGRTLTHVKNK